MRSLKCLGVLVLGMTVACGDHFKSSEPNKGDSGAGAINGGGQEDDAGAKDSAKDAPISLVDAQPPPQCDGTKRPDQDACVIDEAFGVFVSASKGNDSTGNGSRTLPFATLTKAIIAGMQAGRRVYACAETYAESIDLANGVDVYGYFDCTANWKVTMTRAKVLSPKSPAATATNITKDTRVDSLDVVSPDVSAAGGSSIGLLANNSGGLHIVNTKVHAGSAGKGADGSVAIQLTESGNKNGHGGSPETYCQGAFFCEQSHDSQPGGSMTCVGEGGHDPVAGGAGGSGGYYTLDQPLQWVFVANKPATGSGLPLVANGQVAKGGVYNGAILGDFGVRGADGSNGSHAALGTFGPSGYTPANGTSGGAGAPGQSGGGGAGGDPGVLHDANWYAPKDIGVWGSSGGSGGAGGCPGLAGASGKGGGASIGVVAVSSAMTFDSSIIESSTGGGAGSGGAPSKPTTGGTFGGAPMNNITYLAGRGGSGGDGGNAGWSGSGAAGPSVAIAYSSNAKPKVIATTLSQGKGGAGTPAINNTPSQPDGVSVDKLAF